MLRLIGRIGPGSTPLARSSISQLRRELLVPSRRHNSSLNPMGTTNLGLGNVDVGRNVRSRRKLIYGLGILTASTLLLTAYVARELDTTLESVYEVTVENYAVDLDDYDQCALLFRDLSWAAFKGLPSFNPEDGPAAASRMLAALGVFNPELDAERRASFHTQMKRVVEEVRQLLRPETSSAPGLDKKLMAAIAVFSAYSDERSDSPHAMGKVMKAVRQRHFDEELARVSKQERPS